MYARRVLFPFILSCLTSTVIANAYVESGTISENQLKIEYPLVYTDNTSSQNTINSDIANIVYEMKQNYDNGQYYSANMRYEVTYEDSDVISILLHNYAVKSPGAAHGSVWYTGLVYNKHTGNRISLENYVNIQSADQIQYGLLDNILYSYNANGQRNFFYQQTGWSVKYISQNYILSGYGRVDLIYQPYSIGPFAFGPYRVIFTPKAIDYFNRLNS